MKQVKSILNTFYVGPEIIKVNFDHIGLLSVKNMLFAIGESF